GGFGGAPKFPLPLSLEFLLRYHFRTGKDLALSSATKTLDEIQAGGIRDHVGGGFHRYSTDRVWLVPHFEKMLYDNALLAKVYAEGFQATGKPEYAEVVRETIRWMVREMRSDSGGFYSAQDADTEDGEGRYYSWTPGEVKGILGEAEGAEFNRIFGVTSTGNFEGRTLLHLDPRAELKEEDRKKIAGWKEELYLERLKRPKPATDDKILTSWNGLAISAFAYAGAVLGDRGYVEGAEGAAKFILEKVSLKGRLLRRYAGGQAALAGTLEDYAFFIQGLLELFEATGEARWLEDALKLAKVMTDDFEDKEAGGFYFTAEADPVRLKEAYDGPTPSGNSVAALVLVRLSELTADSGFAKLAEGTLKAFGKGLESRPSSHVCMLAAADLLINGTREVVITARTEKSAAPMRAEVFRRFIPDTVLVTATAETYPRLAKLTGLLEGREPTPRARAYVCQRFACKLPVDTVQALASQLAAR
ncbi:MAG TPA: thioredoxin domain-containing protein, partial [Nitrososphaerales archaeon]|nr:thioredoxin domain-containing protein [Nitrososphaerales archaeon]